ncbi:hypothetical protein [Schinkia azotoformans]|uniref:hypothetical protein n=1 Tax=Schinkia azotoformans TaxID=1454 RepID=UPI002DB859B3|nr:hypothetical protein [Schinkia azotoformans]MEC1780047.1 hypothetical protein [Schinkia azotoformans]MED4330874.1 hypothetical protein [Schinkia azotoformans]
MQATLQQPVTNELYLYKKIMILTEFLLDQNLEDEYVDYLYSIKNKSVWADFKEEINTAIAEFEINDKQIKEASIKLFLSVGGF